MVSDPLGLAEDPLPFCPINVHEYCYDFMKFIGVVMVASFGKSSFHISVGT